MLGRNFILFTRPFSKMTSATPMTDALRSKITENLKPTHLEIHNDSHFHAHHSAMSGITSTETHFRLIITSDEFRSKTQPTRHRMVYALMKEELANGSIHALQLETRTPEEAQARAERGAKEV
ncbi:UV-induced protein uvi31 [Erysiphe neolycopersici]|uniref:UV-induced protein uvi31 n=1 Tax=Erysiphe neolycopersici TaxID=212602 RepID=A0A420HXG6_9PEZI|nr:UV-induced protein uvi31 [Erysiphe neolycopersici]